MFYDFVGANAEKSTGRLTEHPYSAFLSVAILLVPRQEIPYNEETWTNPVRESTVQ